MEQEGHCPTDYIKLKRKLCTKEWKKGNWKELQIVKPIPHIVFMLLLSLMDNQWKFFLELNLAAIVGSLLLNIQELLSVQIDQHIIMMISIVKATPRDLLILLIALIGGSHEGTLTPICAQQFLAKLHLKNKCHRLSSLCSMHNSQACAFFLRAPLCLTCLLVKAKRTLCVSSDI
jgi:hypothetical protein